ncbi:lipocalin-like domain protein, partial [Vibrio cholerae HC-62B1]
NGTRLLDSITPLKEV